MKQQAEESMVHSPESLFVFAAPASSLESTHSAKILAHPTIPGVVRSLGRIQAVMVARSRPPRHLFSPTSLEPRRVGSALPYRCDRWSDRVCVPGETKGTPRAGAGGVFIFNVAQIQSVSGDQFIGKSRGNNTQTCTCNHGNDERLTVARS